MAQEEAHTDDVSMDVDIPLDNPHAYLFGDAPLVPEVPKPVAPVKTSQKAATPKQSKSSKNIPASSKSYDPKDYDERFKSTIEYASYFTCIVSLSMRATVAADQASFEKH